LSRQPAGFLRFALPFGFRLLGQVIFQQQAIRRGQPLNALENIVNSFPHGNTSKWARIDPTAVICCFILPARPGAR
jgi:hypothetical protein